MNFNEFVIKQLEEENLELRRYIQKLEFQAYALQEKIEKLNATDDTNIVNDDGEG